MTTVSAWAPPTAERASEHDRARRAVVFGSCPEWCDGIPHLDDDLTQHYADLGSVGPVMVALSQPLDDFGHASGPVGVTVSADDCGSRVHVLDPEHLAALRDLLDHADARLAAVRAGLA